MQRYKFKLKNTNINGYFVNFSRIHAIKKVEYAISSVEEADEIFLHDFVDVAERAKALLTSFC